MERPSSRVLKFGGHALDCGRCALFRGAQEIPLRPKSFDVLRYLAERPGRVITKSEALEQVWPGVFVTEDSLVQCIGEIREALGEDARLIRTVPRRGYLFATEVVAAEALARLPAPAGEMLPSRRLPPKRGWVVTAAILLCLAVGWIAWDMLSVAGRTQRVADASDHRAASSSVARSAGAAASGRRVALVVGNGNYEIGPLANPRRDAQAVARSLQEAGFATVNLQLDLPRASLIDVLDRFAKDTAQADWAVVYFAGRGIEVDGSNFLLPVDARIETEDDIAGDAIPLHRVLRAMRDAKKLRLVILDACRENPGAIATGSLRQLAALDEDVAGPGSAATLVAYAASQGQRAEDGVGANSPYAAALVDALATPGLEIGQLFRRVRDEVLAATAQRQEPFLYGSLPAEGLYFRQ